MPAVGEERPQRPVDHPRRQRRLLPGATLPAEEGPGDLACRVVTLLDVDGQWQEVDVAQVADGRGREHHRVPRAHDDGAARLTGEFAGLKGDLLAAYLPRDAAHVKHSHVCLFPSAARMTAHNRSELLVLVRGDVTERANAGRPDRQLAPPGRSRAYRSRRPESHSRSR